MPFMLSVCLVDCANTIHAMKYPLVLSLIIVSACLVGMTGGQQQTVVVPNVEGISLELAAHMLQNVGLQAEGRPAVLTSLVTRQYPRPGFEVYEGTVVTLFTEGQVSPQTQNIDPGTSSVAALSPEPRIGIQSIQQQSYYSTQNPSLGGGTGVTVIPLDSAAIQGQLRVQSTTMQPLNTSTIFYEPIQPRVSPYFVQSQTQRFYPAWYPKELIPSSASSTQGVMMIQTQPINCEQCYSAYGIGGIPVYQPTATVSGSSSIQRYPRVIQGGAGALSIDSGATTRVGLIETTTSPAVPVPNVVRLHQQYAISALTRAGLFPGPILLVDSDQVRSGYVVQQSPQARQLVHSGTRVQLWIAR